MNLTNLSQVAKLNFVYIFLLLGIYYFHPVGYVSLAYYVLVYGTQGCLIQNFNPWTFYEEEYFAVALG